MHIDHRTMASFGRYILLAIAGSAAAQIVAWFPQMRIVVVLLLAVGAVVLAIFASRYYGLYTNKRWAQGIDVQALDQGAIEFSLFAAFTLIGLIATWTTY